MSFELGIKITGVEQVITAFDRWEQDLGNLRGPLISLAREVISPLLAERFAKQGPGWKPLNAYYAAWKAAHFPGKGILERTGAMRKAFAGGVGFEFEVTNTRLTLDPKRVPYWRYHQTGTKRMPARPIIAFTENERTLMLAHLADKAAGFARAAGLTVREAA